MKNVTYYITAILLTITLAGCNKDEVDKAWKEANWNHYQQIRQNPEYEELQTPTGPTGIYRRTLQGDTTLSAEHPLQTSTVKILYSGKYYNDVTFDKGSGNIQPTEFNLTGNNTIRGFSFALQQMSPGNHWEIVIPYYLGYGETGLVDGYTTLIDGYTTLIFDIRLLEIIKYPK
jgi:FKBP-type peptidyl-prolyl cis-trans isomerase